jgi:hypothetical protein
VCKSACDGASGCGFPQIDIPCAKCMMCYGDGTCSYRVPYCRGSGGAGGDSSPRGGAGGSGGYSPPDGGWGGTVMATGGYGPSSGGAGGSSTSPGGAGGTGHADAGSIVKGGAGGLGASGGSLSSAGASGLGGRMVGSGGASGGSGGKMDGGIPAGGGGNRDAGSTSLVGKLHRSGCSCELGRARTTGTSLAAVLFLSSLTLLVARARRRIHPSRRLLLPLRSGARMGRSSMTARRGAILALLLLATCSEEAQKPRPPSSYAVESTERFLGKVPPSELAVWQ